MTSNSTMLAIDLYMPNLVKSTRIDSRVGRLAIEIAHKSNDHLLVDGRSPNGLTASYLYFAAISLGIDLPLSSIAGFTDFEIHSRCKDFATQRLAHE